VAAIHSPSLDSFVLHDDVSTVKVKLVHPDAKMPTRAYPTDSGYDLYSVEDTILERSQTRVIDCGVAFQLPSMYEAQIRPRSSVSKNSVLCHFGTVDETYTGSCKVTLTNLGDCFYPVAKGDRIAQVVFVQRNNPQLVEITVDLRVTDRGTKGYGSSGK
jgi:dUTP pyrophosphatase